MEEKPSYTIIGKDTTVRGDLQVVGSIMVAGTVVGNITSGDTVRVARGARIHGDIIAKHAIIGGTVEGTLKTSGKVVLGDKSRLTGDLVAVMVTIEEGAFFEGKCEMPKDVKKSSWKDSPEDSQTSDKIITRSHEQ
jgi:cytoskeletal protein CcmA (bactofilin family)